MKEQIAKAQIKSMDMICLVVLDLKWVKGFQVKEDSQLLKGKNITDKWYTKNEMVNGAVLLDNT